MAKKQVTPAPRSKKSWTTDTKTDRSSEIPKKEKFDFEKMKAAATSDDPRVREVAFLEYFDRFREFPSYLFDNDRKIDQRLAQTMTDLSKSKNASKELLDGIAALLNRLPS